MPHTDRGPAQMHHSSLERAVSPFPNLAGDRSGRTRLTRMVGPTHGAGSPPCRRQRAPSGPPGGSMASVGWPGGGGMPSKRGPAPCPTAGVSHPYLADCPRSGRPPGLREAAADLARRARATRPRDGDTGARAGPSRSCAGTWPRRAWRAAPPARAPVEAASTPAQPPAPHPAAGKPRGPASSIPSWRAGRPGRSGGRPSADTGTGRVGEAPRAGWRRLHFGWTADRR